MNRNVLSSDRRMFLKSSASATVGAVAAPWIVRPAAVQAASGWAASDRINMGFAGVGGMGGGHLEWFLNQRDVQVRAVCDVDANHLGEAKKRVDGTYESSDCAAYGDFRELLAREDIDAVLVATPDHWHGLVSAAAAREGKHVYCEKPLVNTIGEGRALSDAVRENNVVLQAGCHERSGVNIRFAQQIVYEGRLGEIHTVRIHLPCDQDHHMTVKQASSPAALDEAPPELNDDMWLGPAPAAPYTELGRHFHWRFNLAYGGGEMTDRGAHVIDLAHLILGLDETGPVEISARGAKVDVRPYLTYMDFSFENIYPGGLRMIGDSQGPRGLHLDGDEGSLFIAVHGAQLKAEPKSILDGWSPWRGDAYAIHRREFLDCIRNGNRPIAHAEAGHRTAAACHVNTIAMRLGRDLKWDPAAEQFDDDEANALVSPPMRAPWKI